MHTPFSSMRLVRVIASVAATAAIGLGAAAPAAAQVSVNIGQPGFYGQLNIGGYPPPVLYSPQPVVVERRYVGAPVYLRVPEGHRRHWSKHCYRYNACGRQVYFVQDSWYTNTYAPRYRDGHYRDRPVIVRENFYGAPHRDGYRDSYRESYRDGRRDGRHEERREERHEERRDHDGRGPGNGNGHGNGHGNGNGNGHGRHGD